MRKLSRWDAIRIGIFVGLLALSALAASGIVPLGDPGGGPGPRNVVSALLA